MQGRVGRPGPQRISATPGDRRLRAARAEGKGSRGGGGARRNQIPSCACSLGAARYYRHVDLSDRAHSLAPCDGGRQRCWTPDCTVRAAPAMLPAMHWHWHCPVSITGPARRSRSSTFDATAKAGPIASSFECSSSSPSLRAPSFLRTDWTTQTIGLTGTGAGRWW